MLHLALTGNIASGKSTVAELFQSWGAVIIDADQIVRELQQPGSPVLGAIATRFGSDVILSDGQLDRGKVRQIVMRDPEARADLNAIVHPEVHRRRAELVEAAKRQGTQVVVSDAAGAFLFSRVPIGNYELRVEKAGFSVKRLQPETRLAPVRWFT